MYSDGDRTVRSTGKVGGGGEQVEYEVFIGQGLRSEGEVLGSLHFQNDTIPNVGVVGWTNEALLAVIADRLVAFQTGGFPCDENQSALDSVNAARMSLESRTADRKSRGVEGVHTA